MTERPILFSGPMVRALLCGTKTQTRRVVKNTGLYAIDASIHGAETAARELASLATRCPYGQPGDRLWVRETWRSYPMAGVDGAPGVLYRATYGPEQADALKPWKPSIHMPRAACRLELEVTDVRVQRLQAISEADAIAEGTPADAGDRPIRCHEEALRHADVPLPLLPAVLTPLECFEGLWNSINGKRGRGWDANPFVWVVGFRRVEARHASA